MTGARRPPVVARRWSLGGTADALEVAVQFLALGQQAPRLAFTEGARKFGDLDPRVQLGATAERQVPVCRLGRDGLVGRGERAGEVEAFALQVLALPAVIGRPRLPEELCREQDAFLPGDESGEQGFSMRPIPAGELARTSAHPWGRSPGRFRGAAAEGAGA